MGERLGLDVGFIVGESVGYYCKSSGVKEVSQRTEFITMTTQLHYHYNEPKLTRVGSRLSMCSRWWDRDRDECESNSRLK